MMRVRDLHGIVPLLLTAACAPADAPEPRAPERPIDRPVRAEPAPSPFGDFVRRASRTRSPQLRLAGGEALALIDQRRVVFDAGGRVIGVADGAPNARGVAAIPEALGGGIAIHGGSGLYRAERPLGPLTRVLALDVDRVSFGPRGALVTLGDGRRRMVDLATGALATASPPFAVSMAVASRNLAVALLADGSARISRDGGGTWQAAPAHERPFAEVTLDEARAGVVLVDDRLAAFRVDGPRLVPTPVPPRAPEPGTRDARWPDRDEPLEAAVARGAVLDDARAIVSARGGVFILDRASGAIVSAEAGVLPPNRPCTAIGLARDVLFACQDDGRLSVVRWPRAGGPTHVEATFAGGGHLVRGDGDALLYTGTCEGDASRVGVACLRKKDGTWAPLDRSALFQAQPAGVVLAWIPTESSAVAILGGDAVGILDGATGERSVLDKAAGQKLSAIAAPRTELVEHRFRQIGDAIEGWSASGDFVRIEKGGALVKLAPSRMPHVRFAGPLGLASGPDDTLWQTRDWGRTFIEVPSPPLRIGAPQACGEVGCTFGQWIRRGWSVVRARPERVERRSEPTASLPSPPLPALRCTVSGAQTTKLQAADARESPFGLGAELLRDVDVITTYGDGASDFSARLDVGEDLRAVESGPGPRGTDDAIDPATSRRVRFIAPFDPLAVVQTTSVPMRRLLEGARRAGEDRPDASDLDGEAFAVPVLAATGAPTELLLTRPDLHIATWIRGRDAVVLSTSTPDAELAAVTAAARQGDALALAIGDASGGAHLHLATPGTVSALLDVPGGGERSEPHQLDTVALAMDGRPALLRVATRTPPDADDPALVLRPGAPPMALAPWSTLAPDGSAGCEGQDGFRAIVSTSPPWIRIGPAPVDEGRMVARVRWSEQRVCLEAAEVTNTTHDTPHGEVRSRLVATFGAKPAGGLVLVGRGVELREPRTCELVPAPAR